MKLKQCCSCKIEKPYEAFGKSAQTFDGYKYCCRECRSIEYYKNQAQEKEKRKEHYLKTKSSYINRSTQWRLKNPKKKQAWNKVWAAEHKDYYAMYASFRRRGVEQATPKWLSEDDYFLFEEIYHLAKLRTLATGMEWHVDHIIPLKGKYVCGLHIPENLQVILGQENRKKSNKWLV